MLDATELARLERTGYLGPFDITDANAVDALRAQAERGAGSDVVSRTLKRLKLGPSRTLRQRDSHTRSPELYRLASSPDIVERVAAVLGPDLLLWIGIVISRLPGNGGQDWHRDRISLKVDAIHVSVALTEMTISNGCTKVVPSTHDYGESLQRSRKDGLCDLAADGSVTAFADATHPANAPHEVVDVELRPGQFFMARAGFWHAVPANGSDAPRHVMVARYMRPDRVGQHWSDDDSEETIVRSGGLPCVLVRGEDRHGLNRLYPPPRAARAA